MWNFTMLLSEWWMTSKVFFLFWKCYFQPISLMPSASMKKGVSTSAVSRNIVSVILELTLSWNGSVYFDCFCLNV